MCNSPWGNKGVSVGVVVVGWLSGSCLYISIVTWHGETLCKMNASPVSCFSDSIDYSGNPVRFGMAVTYRLPICC